MANGAVVIARLECIKQSLERSLAEVSKTLEYRYDYRDYESSYVSDLTELMHQVHSLEDAVLKNLS